MAVGIPTNLSFGDGTGVTSITWSHTTEAAKDLIVDIGTTSNDFANTGVLACTFDGVALTPKVIWSGAGVGFVRKMVFVLKNPAVKTANIVYTIVTAACDMSGIGYNISGMGVNGDIILAGANFTGNAAQTRKAYSWGSGVTGLQIASLWAQLGAAGTSITGGTNAGAGDGTELNYITSTNGEIIWIGNMTPSFGREQVLLSYLIPDGSLAISSGTYFPIIGGQTPINSLAVGNKVYAGLPYGGLSFNQSRQGNLIPYPGTIKSFAVELSEAPGVGNSVRCEIYRGGGSEGVSDIGKTFDIPTGYVVTITGTSTEGSFIGDLSHYAYERLTLVYLNDGAGSLPSTLTATASFLHDSGEDNAQVYGGGEQGFLGAGVDVPYSRAPLHPLGVTNWGLFPNSEKSLVGINATITELIVNYQTFVTLALDHDYYLEITRYLGGQVWDTPELQDGTGGTVDTRAVLINNTLGPALARKTFSLTIAPGDFISVVGFLRNAASAELRQAATIKVIPTVAGDMMISGHSVETGAVDFIALTNSSRDEYDSTTAESRYQNIIPPMSAIVGNPFKSKGLIGALETTGPGGSKGITFKLRNNAVDAGIDLPFIDNEVFQSVVGDADFADLANMGMFMEAINGPTLARQFWSMPGSSLAPDLGTIIVVKDAGGNTTANFTFVATGITPTPFILQGGGQQVYNDVTTGSGYGFVETPPAGWQQISVTVSNGSPIDDISVTSGEVVIVTFVNALITPANNASGLYEMIPGKTDDTIWVDVSLGIDVDVPIP